MGKSDHKYFSCKDTDAKDPEHELRSKARKYKESQQVLDFLRAKCADKTIKNWTHKQVNDLLETKSFELKDD